MHPRREDAEIRVLRMEESAVGRREEDVEGVDYAARVCRQRHIFYFQMF